MSRLKRLTLALFLVVAFSLAPLLVQASDRPLPDGGAAPGAVAQPLNCVDGDQASGAVYRICMPWLSWNGDLVVYAHGYVHPDEPVGIPEDQMAINGIAISDIVTLMGYGFAASSYSTNGLAVVPAMDDLLDVVDIFAAQKGAPNRVFLVGASEGGLITTLLAEQHPEVFDGGLALCGPYGDFMHQIDYFGDIRVVFDYFFPALMPPTPVDVPQWLIDDWEPYYQAHVKPAIVDPANASEVDQLLAVTGAPYDAGVASTKEESLYGTLSYNVMATNDGRQKLGGQPFDNQARVYSGSDDDAHLNQQVQRFDGEQVARDEIDAHYQTSGQLSVPLVTLHTTLDPIVPYWHALRYRAKTIHADNMALHEHREVAAYGHCNFSAEQVLAAFDRLVEMVDNPPPYRPVQRLFLPLTVDAP
jgi:pimeloyl-ACP methyl ester carboxylesterase